MTIADRLLEELNVKVDSAVFMSGLTVNDLIHIVTGGNSQVSESSSASTTPPMSSPRVEAAREGTGIRNGGTDTPLSSMSLQSAPGSDSDGYLVIGKQGADRNLRKSRSARTYLVNFACSQ